MSGFCFSMRLFDEISGKVGQKQHKDGVNL